MSTHVIIIAKFCDSHYIDKILELLLMRRATASV